MTETESAMIAAVLDVFREEAGPCDLYINSDPSDGPSATVVIGSDRGARWWRDETADAPSAPVFELCPACALDVGRRAERDGLTVGWWGPEIDPGTTHLADVH